MALDPEAEDPVAVLVRQFETDSAFGRRLAAARLAELGSAAEPAVPPLIAGLRHADVAVRVSAAHALASIGRGSVVPLLQALQDEDVDFRQAIIVTLGQVGRPARTAVPVLTVALEDERLGPAAAEALRNINRSQLRVLLSRLESWLPDLTILGGIAAVGLLVLALVSWVSEEVFGGGDVPQITAAAVALLGASLGAVVGANRAGVAGAVGGAVVLGFGGALTGLLLGTIMGGIVAPVGKSLGGP